MLDRRRQDEGFMSQDLAQFEQKGSMAFMNAGRKSLCELSTGAVDIDFRGDKEKAKLKTAQVKLIAFLDETIEGFKGFETKEEISLMRYMRRPVLFKTSVHISCRILQTNFYSITKPADSSSVGTDLFETVVVADLLPSWWEPF